MKETKFGTYVETESSTKLTGDKITRFVERLKKIGIEVKLVGNFPWVYIDEICGQGGAGELDSSRQGQGSGYPDQCMGAGHADRDVPSKSG